MSLPPLIDEKVMPIRQIDDRLAGEWALIKILDSTVPMGDAPGVVLAHGIDRKKMSDELRRAWKRDPEAHLTVMLCGGSFGDGGALRRALARIADEDDVNVSVNSWK